MTRPNVYIYNADTGEDIVREMNDEEYAQYLIDKENLEIEKAERQAKEQAEQAERDAAKAAVEAKLAALGLDLETIKTIAKL